MTEPTIRYRHVIWDWNGTLFDDAWLSVEIINQILGKRNLPTVDAERYQREFDFPVKDYYRRLGFDFSREPFEILAAEFVATYDRRRFECGLQPGAREMLLALAQAGYTQSILSAYEQGRLEEMVVHVGLQSVITNLVGLRDYYADGKIDYGKRLIADLACPPGEVVLIGDTVHDFEVAAAMGIACVLVPSGHHSPEKLRSCGVPVVETLADFSQFMNG
ncbi:MAG: HAD family hydrolase [Armatimonadota bacterium]